MSATPVPFTAQCVFGYNTSTGMWVPLTTDSSGNLNTTGGGGGGAPYNYTDLGYVQMTSLGTATALSSIPSGAKYAFITVEGAAIRYRADAVNPTASVGIPISAGQQIMVSTSLANVRVIQQSAGAILNIEYAQ